MRPEAMSFFWQSVEEQYHNEEMGGTVHICMVGIIILLSEQAASMSYHDNLLDIRHGFTHEDHAVVPNFDNVKCQHCVQ